ncbi:hypothetical protein CC2G_000259 [Coprinopsis cinerea AmutBmut pab1-1]|nr:hypothetical protein CC2G_000259 [Coprinopsis cinerea AmutBmut pab1-1]
MALLDFLSRKKGHDGMDAELETKLEPLGRSGRTSKTKADDIVETNAFRTLRTRVDDLTSFGPGSGYSSYSSLLYFASAIHATGRFILTNPIPGSWVSTVTTIPEVDTVTQDSGDLSSCLNLYTNEMPVSRTVTLLNELD